MPNVERNLEFTLTSPEGITIGQGSLSSFALTENISTNLSAYSLFTVRVKNSNDGVLTADNLKFILNRAFESIPFSFGTNNMPITISTQQMANGINASALTNTEISEILVYNGQLSETQFESIRQYLKTKWNITYQTI